MLSDRELIIESLRWIRGSIMQLEGAMHQKAHRWDSTDLADARDAQAILKNLEHTFEGKIKEDVDA